MIGKVVSRYEILEKLGEGGMGVVCKTRSRGPDVDALIASSGIRKSR